MKSKTQQPITQDQLIKILHHHFGKDIDYTNIKELSEGWYSIAYSVDLPQKGFNIIIKLAIPKGSRSQIYEYRAMETEIKVMELIAAHPNGKEIPLPGLIAYDLEGSLIGRGYFITKKFQGIPLDKAMRKIPKEDKANVELQIGKMQAKINTIIGDKFGYFIDHTEYPVHSDTWGESFALMMQNLFRDADHYGVKLPIDRKLVTEYLQRAQWALNMVDKPYLVHWDLWLGNIFVIKTNGKWELEGIIDFERAIWGDPLTESSLRGKKKKANLIKGYGTDLFASKEAKIRDAFYDLYLGTTLIVETYVREYSKFIRLMYKIFSASHWKPAMKHLGKELN